MASAWPISFDDVLAARERLRPFLAPTPLRSYPLLDEAVGHGIRVLVKHENFQPTGSFKVRNGLSLVSGLTEAARARGLVAATRGNHGLGIAWAGRRFGAPVTICVPFGNNPEKNADMLALGARLVEEGRDYDEAVEVAARIVRETGATLAHSTNDRAVIAGAATITVEVLEEEPDLEAMVLAVGGGSQAVGAMTVARALRPALEVFAVQASGAAATHDSWHAGKVISRASANTFADGLATRMPYTLTFGALCEGLAGFVTVTEDETARALRLILRTTHSLVEGAGAAGLAGLTKLGGRLAGKRAAVVLTGANIDRETLRRVVAGEV